MILPISRAVFKMHGWTFKGKEFVDEHRRCVVMAAPHTSNWDLLYMLASFDRVGLPLRFTIKQVWMKFPAKYLVGPAGAIAIDRRPRAETGERPSLVEAMIEIFKQREGDLALAITPEGTRSDRDRWKSGFYHVARGADVPLLLGYLDYAKKEAGVGKVMHLSDDYEADMREIMEFYEPITPRHPERFSLDARFRP